MKQLAAIVCVAFLFCGLASLADATPLPQDEGDKKSAEKKEKKKEQKEKKRRGKKAKEAAPEDPQMAAYMAAGKPGEAHAMLKGMAGRWVVMGKFWMDPNAPPMETKGISNVRAILGGRFTQEDYKSEFLGMNFQGRGLTGYDNAKKKFTSLWMDNFSTAMMPMEGTLDDSGKVITFRGTHYDPVRKKDVNAKAVLTITAKDRHVYESYEVNADGSETKGMHLVYERKAPPAKKKKETKEKK